MSRISEDLKRMQEDCAKKTILQHSSYIMTGVSMVLDEIIENPEIIQKAARVMGALRSNLVASGFTREEAISVMIAAIRASRRE